jgi:hypothetical protein
MSLTSLLPDAGSTFHWLSANDPKPVDVVLPASGEAAWSHLAVELKNLAGDYAHEPTPSVRARLGDYLNEMRRAAEAYLELLGAEESDDGAVLAGAAGAG